MADTITVDDVVAWLNPKAGSWSAATTAQCQLALDAVLAHTARYYPPPSDALGVELDPWPADYRLGLIMKVASLRKRPESPTGTISFDGFAERVAAYDPDIIALLSPFEAHRFG